MSDASPRPARSEMESAPAAAGADPVAGAPDGPLPGLTHLARGKVRDLYAVGSDVLVVASDRISAYDVVLPTPIPDKGKVLTALSVWWFAQTGDIVPNHLRTADVAQFPPELASYAEQLRGRAMLCRRLDMLPVECVARGYLTGSGLADYTRTGTICGVSLPAGLVDGSLLPAPIFTPATKATIGHDENVTFDEVAARLGPRLTARLRDLTLALYERGAALAAERGILLADTKLEFGHDAAGELTLGDEVLTPDSSRFWPKEDYAPGRAQPSFDKQYLRDWLTASGWDRTPPAPELPEDVVAATRARYVEAYERLTGQSFTGA